MGTMTWNLFDPGMDLLERAGLAALSMTLRAAQELGEDLTPLEWTDDDLTADSVTLRWDGSAKDAFCRLFRFAWQEKDGVLFFPTVHREQRQRENYFDRIGMHSGILSTFLQHTKVQPKGPRLARNETFDEGKEMVLHYQTLAGKALKPHSDIQSIFVRSGPQKGQFAETADFSSWIAPGFAARCPGDAAGTIAAWKAKPW